MALGLTLHRPLLKGVSGKERVEWWPGIWDLPREDFSGGRAWRTRHLWNLARGTVKRNQAVVLAAFDGPRSRPGWPREGSQHGGGISSSAHLFLLMPFLGVWIVQVKMNYFWLLL